MTEKKSAAKKGKTDPKDVINTATSAASGVPKPIIDAATKPPTAKPKPPKEPERPEDKISEGTADISKKKKKN